MRFLTIVALVNGCVVAVALGGVAMGDAVLPGAPDPDAATWRRLREVIYAQPDPAARPLTPLAPQASEPSTHEIQAFVPGQGVGRWKVAESAIVRPAAQAVDQLRVAVGQIVQGPGGLPPAPGAPVVSERLAYEVTYTRNWPRQVAAGDFDVAVTPHAGVGVTSAGGEAEAGASVQVSRPSWSDQFAPAGGERFGDRGRWYLFGAASGRAVGLNMLHDKDGWTRGGLSSDAASALISDVQAGVGWRKGSVQASLAWMKRKVKAAQTFVGLDARDDTTVAVTLSVKPRK